MANIFKFLKMAYNTFNYSSVVDMSLYESVFERKQTLLKDVETTPDAKVSGTPKDYYIL